MEVDLSRRSSALKLSQFLENEELTPRKPWAEKISRVLKAFQVSHNYAVEDWWIPDLFIHFSRKKSSCAYAGRFAVPAAGAGH